MKCKKEKREEDKWYKYNIGKEKKERVKRTCKREEDRYVIGHWSIRSVKAYS